MKRQDPSQGHHSSPAHLNKEQLEALREFETCALLNAIEEFSVRLRNEGYAQPGMHCVTDPGARILGYAIPCRVHTKGPPIAGRFYQDRTDWWNLMQTFPAPRIAVVEDASGEGPVGAVAGEVHCAILQALGCAGLITNGAVRDLPAVRQLEFPLFAATVCPSHSYVHMIDFGQPVEILGLKVHSGDLLYADCHGVISIPLEIAAALPAVARRQATQDRRIVELCKSPDFSLERLLHAVKDLG